MNGHILVSRGEKKTWVRCYCCSYILKCEINTKFENAWSLKLSKQLNTFIETHVENNTSCRENVDINMIQTPSEALQED